MSPWKFLRIRPSGMDNVSRNPITLYFYSGIQSDNSTVMNDPLRADTNGPDRIPEKEY